MLRLLNLWRRGAENNQAADLRSAYDAGHLEGTLETIADLTSENGWQSYRDFDTGVGDTNIVGTPERHAYTRYALMSAAVDVLNALTLGTGVTYGTMDDATAYRALEDWYTLNDLDQYVPLILNQWLLDGELLILLAQNAAPNMPAWLNTWDTQTTPVTLKTTPGNPREITGVALPDRVVTPDGFAWRANRATATATEATSPLRAAVEPACDYSRLLKARLRAHEIRARINVVYYAFARNPQELAARSNVLRRIPRSGQAMVLQRHPESGQSEGLEMVSTKTDASDAESDLRAFVRTVAMVAGVPEHFLAIGDTGNRATAESMAEPMVRRIERHQTLILGILTELFRKELVRRYGPARRYRQVTTTSDGLERRTVEEYVLASELEIPWALPPVRENAKALDAIRFAVQEDLISRQTATEELGYDPALEAERLAGETDDSNDGPNDDPDPGTDTPPDPGEEET